MWLCFLQGVLALAYSIQTTNLPHSTSYHPDYRHESRFVRCSREGDDNLRTICSVIAEDITTKPGERCWNDFEPELKSIRYMCPTLCQSADEYEIIHKVPSNNHVCIKFENYGLVKRKKDIYLWRRGECINETIAFNINCGFPLSRRNLKKAQNDPSNFLTKLLARQ
ncbi:unnamed protein product [Cylicocyclus nassatus]|uniref:DUF7808 domain-containing protein n=1 Tax=Cylicocyclus nassatus TaxID=53992 RepID=A0AA36M795_CYLNA|nr:unnamed protein product [Cylicocyclus nassatus]